MGIKTQKVLRLISKIILILVGIAVVGYCGLVVYKSVVNRPQKVRVTNVTDSAVTITWVTKNPVRGVVYYNAKDTVLPGPFGFLFSNVGYDDRDFAVAQKDCVNAFNENAKNTKDANFAVSGSNFDCENIKVEKLGAYYTHSITLKNLNESSTYFFKVGNGIWSWGINGVGKDITTNDLPLATKFNFVTGITSSTVPTPNIAYGNVYAAEMVENQIITESTSKDSLVFGYLTIGGVNSQTVSAVTNADGGWIFDKSNFRDASGNLITDLSSAKLTVCSQYESVNPKVCLEVSEDLDKDTNVDLLGNVVDDLGTYEKNFLLDKFDQLIGKVYAVSTKPNGYVCTGSVGVVSCSDLTCIQKCGPTSAGPFDWYAVGGTCPKPYSCGCEKNACEDKCGTNGANVRKCVDQGGYLAWGSWSMGKCGASDPCSICSPGQCRTVSAGVVQYCASDGKSWGAANTGSCGGGNDNGTICTAGACQTVSTGVVRYCASDGKSWGTATTGSCSSNTGKCLNGSIENGAQCPNNQGTCTNGTCVPAATEYCSDGTTKVGFCTTGSKKCTTKGGALAVSDSCKCKDGNNLVIVGGCIGLTQHTCGINSSTGTVGPTVATFAGCPSPETAPQKCTLDPKYKPGIEGEKVLDSCTLTCDEVARILAPKECKKLAPIKDPLYPIDSEFNGGVETIPLDLSNIDSTDLKLLLQVDPEARAALFAQLDGLAKKADAWKCGSDEGDKKRFGTVCKALGGKVNYIIDDYCLTDNSKFQAHGYSCPGATASNPTTIIGKVYAESSNSENYTLYLPEYGLFSLQLGNYNLQTEVSNGNTYYLFYLETNGIAGFQMPEDSDNPTVDEDIIIRSQSAAITYEKLSSAQKYAIVKGINLVSFDFVPVATNLGAYSASDVISQAAKDGVTIQYISTFDGGRWNQGYSCTTTPCTGNDFTIVPGRGYLIYATTEGEVTIPGYTLTSAVPVAFSAGWNLVGVHGYTTAYTARSFIDSINTVKGLTANNVSWWPTSKSKYEGLQVDSGTEYGLDFPISPTNGYFVRISNFTPSDTTCKSLIWQPGGTLNGTCGNTK